MRSALFTLLSLLLPWVPQAAAQQADEHAQLSLTATVDTSELDRSGRFTLKLAFKVIKMVDRPYRVRVAIISGQDVLFTRDHTPPTRVSSWAVGETVRYELPSLFPLGTLAEKELADTLDVYVGLLDVSAGGEKAKLVPEGASSKVLDGRRYVASFGKPREEGGLSMVEEEAVIARSQALMKQEPPDPRQAWDELEFALRRSDDYGQKKRLRQAIEALGFFEPRPLTRVEENVVRDRIKDEKVRYLRLWAGKMHGKKMYRGALALLEEIGGELQENNREAVIGALDEAKRVGRDAESIKRRLVQDVVKKDADVIKDLDNVKEWREREKLLEIADQLLKRGHKGAAWEALRRARDDGDEAVSKEAVRRRKELEAEIIKGDGLTEAEKAEIAKAKEHPAWDRLYWAPTHRFIFIGPKKEIEGIIRQQMRTRRLDLAYVFQTDLFGRTPNAGGTRITVFLKELWDFGGGQAGGNKIDIGNADPENENYRVDTGLMYHELTHCIYSFVRGYPGFNEGIANFGACFTMDVLDQSADQLHSLKRNLRDFREDYVNRDMAFWRIQKYGPSAGFFLHFIDKYGRKGGELDWQLYRLFFKGFAKTPVMDARPRSAIRAIAYYLVRSFGNEAFDDLITFRFPLEESDREALIAEMEAGDRDEPDWAKNGTGFGRHPNSPRNRDAIYRQLMMLRGRPFEQVKAYSQRYLGTLYTWKVCGPFLANTQRSFAEVFAPEQGEIDFEKRYEVRGGKHTGVWRDPHTSRTDKYVHIAGDGWVTIDYPYGDHTSSYAYCRLTSPVDVEARLHLRTDDHFTIWFDGRLLHKMKNIGQKGSAPARWRYDRVPDEFMVRLPMKAGVAHPLLIKITNGNGKAGFIAACVGADNRPISGLQVDIVPPPRPEVDKKGRPKQPKIKWKKSMVFTERQLASVLKATVGRTKSISRNKEKKILVGTDTRKRVAWRKYTVRPGFPKDSPSNLMWLPKALTRKVEDFRMEVKLQMKKASVPKMTLTFDGDGGKDGLAGWTLIMVPAGGGMSVRLEKYDNLHYQSWNLKGVKSAATHDIVLQRVDGKVTLTIDGETAFDRIAVPRLRVEGAERIGFATWNDAVGFQSIGFARR